MKKLLLATTAAAAITFGASAARAEIDLDLGGFFKGYAGYSAQDTTASTHNFELKRKSQIYFTGETTLDNGLTVGFNSELMQENKQSDAGGFDDAKSEESYLYMSGNWGRVNLGRENGAAYLLQVAAPSADSNLDGMDVDFSFVNLAVSPGGVGVDQDYQQSGPGNLYAGREAQYSDKVTYLTPKFNGFQAGISYSPTLQAQSVVPGGGAPGYNYGYFGNTNGNLIGAFENQVEGAARYDGEFSGVGVHVGGGYGFARPSVDVGNSDDYKEWNLGAKLTFEGFGFGGAYKTDNSGLTNNGDHDDWTVGADYTYGAYTFGASYFNAQADATAGEDELDRYMVGATYTYGPGMSFRGSVAYYDYDSAAAATIDNTATVATIGTDVQF